ncbi:MAG: FG-GAP-like repeat-containing protein [Pirellulales bacterium]
MSQRAKSSWWKRMVSGKSKSERAASLFRRRSRLFESLEDRHVMTATLKIETLTLNNSLSMNIAPIVGDYDGGIALSTTQVFTTGDNNSGRFSAADLSGGASLGRSYDGLVSDLATGKVYALGKNATTPLSYPPSFFQGETITHLIEIDGATGALTTNAIALSTPLVLGYNNRDATGIFSGAGRVLIQDYQGKVSEIELPTGVVTTKGTIPLLSHVSNEAWAYYGISEHFDGADYLTYIQTAQTVARTRVSDGVTTIVSASVNLNLAKVGDLIVSPTNQRWYTYGPGGGSQSTLVTSDAEITYGVDFAAITPDPRTTGITSLDVTFDAPQPAFGGGAFTVSDLVLTRNGQAVALSGVSITQIPNTNTYRIDGLAAVNGTDGNYQLRVKFGEVTSNTGVEYGGRTTWTVDAVAGAPTVVSTVPANGGNLIATAFNTITVVLSEVVTTATAQNVRNYRLTGPNGVIPVTNAVQGGDGKTVTLTVPTQTTQGSYSLSVGNLQDQVGNAMSALATVNPTPVVTTFTGGELIGQYLQTLADFDGDGIKDLITVRNSDRKDLLFFKGSINGTFATPVVLDNVATGDIAQVTSADLNGDGKQDLIAAQLFGGALILFGNKNYNISDADLSNDNLFQAPHFFAEGQAYSIAVGDVNGDSKLDFVLAGQGGNAKSYLNDPDKEVEDWTVVTSTSSYGYNDFALVDLNTDGKLDFVGTIGTSVYVSLGDGTGKFVPTSFFTSQGGFVDTITVADIDGDGLQDFIAGDNGTAIHYGITRPVGQPFAPFFATSAQLLDSNAGRDARHVEAVDLDGDGDLDLIKGSSNDNGGSGSLFISWNQGNRTFVNETIDLTTFGFNANKGTYTLSFEDLNNDKIPRSSSRHLTATRSSRCTARPRPRRRPSRSSPTSRRQHPSTATRPRTRSRTGAGRDSGQSPSAVIGSVRRIGGILVVGRRERVVCDQLVDGRRHDGRRGHRSGDLWAHRPRDAQQRRLFGS